MYQNLVSHCYHIFFQTYHFVTTSCKLAHTLPLTSIARRGEQSLITKEIEYHSMIELLFNWFGFSWFALLKLSTDLHVWLNTKQQNKRQTCSDTSPYEVRERFLYEETYPNYNAIIV